VGDTFLWAVAPPMLVGAGLSFLLERFMLPRTRPFWRRPSAAFAIHIGLWLLFFSFELAVFRRPCFAAVTVLAILLIVVLVSNAKFKSLHEPFIFQDFEYFTDALKHPRFFLPFFGLWKALIPAVGYGVALFASLTLEPAVTGRATAVDFLMKVTGLAVFGGALLWLGARRKLPLTLEPETDLLQLGLLTSLWRYGEEERTCCCIPPPPCCFAGSSQGMSGILPDLVVVQSESFFDVRNLFAGVRPDILSAFDLIKDAAVCHGKIEVPAWGANTVRTEFSFLSGLNAGKLGVHRFNPYRKLARQGILTLAGVLKQLGYRTVCVHPYPASFYARDKVFPLLGFDEFMDIRSFCESEKTGPNIGDVALAEKVCDLLEPSVTRPVFVFVITMENHGPLHLEKAEGIDAAKLYSMPPQDGCDDLTIYLKHLLNADLMAGILHERLETLPGSSWLCWFGDHVPIMPEVYDALGTPDGKTDYLIWRKGGNPGGGIRRDVKIEDLGCLLLEKMGVVSAQKKDDPTRRHSEASS
jgi:hypothetical protein